MKPTIAVTMGDPAGVGPEVIVKALADAEIAGLADWILVGSREIYARTAADAGVQLPQGIEFDDIGIPGPEPFAMGQVSAACGTAAVRSVEQAVSHCMEHRAQAMATAPLNKEAVVLSGMPFTGHTEYIAQLTGARESRMLLSSDRLQVIHVTTHVALRKACDISQERVLRTIELGYEALQWMGTKDPRIGVCGLNPHAGEHRLFGNEDADTITPAVEAARAKGIPCEGPLPADTAFLRGVRGAFSMVVAMYHDQGHIPMKLLDFEHTVNVSLGLPIIRTSVDHGTAFDIAGQGIADCSNMKSALQLAAKMAKNKHG
jgi:4-hydroxythreonine-4-phosphate dehydrogenase